MGQVAEHSLPSLIRALLIWHESQMKNLLYLKQLHLQQQSQQQAELSSLGNASAKITLKAKQHLLQAKLYAFNFTVYIIYKSTFFLM